MELNGEFALLTLACAVLTYLTRVGGYLVLARFERIPARLEAALNAVPAAVMTTLFAPVALLGWQEALTLGVAAMAGLRLGLLPILFVGVAMIVVLRQFG